MHEAAPGIEPGTSRTRSENHTTRPSSQVTARGEPTNPEIGLVAVTYSHGEQALQCLPDSKNDGGRIRVCRRGQGVQFMLSQRHDLGRTRACNLWFRRPTLYLRAAGGRPKFWADRPAGHVGSRAVLGDWSATEDWLQFAEGIRPRADLNRDHWIQSPEC